MQNETPENEEKLKRLSRLREVCLKNAEALLVASKATLDVGIGHASFHLALLALEELGKMEMESLRTMSEIYPGSKPMRYKFDFEEHERKLFWAIWGGSLGWRKQTKDFIDSSKELAKNLHNRRLESLYTDVVDPQEWNEVMDHAEALKIYQFAEAKLQLEKTTSLDVTAHTEPNEDLEWFFSMNEDEERRMEIWGHKSQNKLIELGNVQDWIKWLRGLYDENQQEIKEIFDKEIKRQKPEAEEEMDPKWRMKLQIVSPSHSIKQKNLEEFNKVSKWIKLTPKGDQNTLGVEMILSKLVPLGALFHHGWGMSRMFLAALNISTHGLFWWNIKKDPARYYEEIWDLENNMGVNIQEGPELEIGWKKRRLVLEQQHLSLTSIIFSYITSCLHNEKQEYFDRYVSGISLLAKTDIHLRMEMNAFENFFISLKTAMIINGDWDQIVPFEQAYQLATSWRFPERTEDMGKFFKLGFEVEKNHTGFVDLTGVYAMKNYCEVYLQTLAVRYFKEAKDVDIRIVTEEDKQDNLDKESTDNDSL